MLSKSDILARVPAESALASWQRCLWKAMQSIQSQSEASQIPYGRADAKFGCTRDVYWQKQRVMIASEPPKTYCCGVVEQAFWEAWSLYYGEQSDGLASRTVMELHRWFFAFDEPAGFYRRGCGEGLRWLDSGRLYGAAVSDTAGIAFGDFCQILNPPGREDHAVIALGVTQHEGRPVLLVWSSTSHYDDGQPGGCGYDYFWLDMAGRSLSVARILERTGEA